MMSFTISLLQMVVSFPFLPMFLRSLPQKGLDCPTKILSLTLIWTRVQFLDIYIFYICHMLHFGRIFFETKQKPSNLEGMILLCYFLEE